MSWNENSITGVFSSRAGRMLLKRMVVIDSLCCTLQCLHIAKTKTYLPYYIRISWIPVTLMCFR